MRFVSYNIVFQEIPSEVTLAISISNCPNCCKGCHSPYLREDIGEILDENVLLELLEKYKNAITCVCFMGGDAAPQEVEGLAKTVREKTKGSIKTAWYSGKSELPDTSFIENFNYIKLGNYIEDLGGLNSATTNQRLYRIENKKMIDITNRFFFN